MRPYYDYGDDRRREYYSSGPSFGSSLTPAVRWIIGVCVAVFLIEVIIGAPSTSAGRTMVYTFGFVPTLAIRHLWVWQFVTYMFLHAGFMHIFFNLFFFWMIGPLVEQSLGTRRFVWLYMLSGGVGALAQGILAQFSPAYGVVPTIGASGAIMGVTAAVAMLYPDMKILLFFILPMKMRHFVWVLVIFQIFGMSSAASRMGAADVAYYAHIAGLIAGYLFIKWQRGASWGMTRLYYRVKARMRGIRGFHGPSEVTHIDDDEKYRQEVDRLLDKIFRQGPQSLSQDEKDFLKKQSEKYKK